MRYPPRPTSLLDSAIRTVYVTGHSSSSRPETGERNRTVHVTMPCFW